MNFDRDKGHVRVGKLCVTWTGRQAQGAPMFDRAWIVLTRMVDDTGRVTSEERFGGWALRAPGKSRHRRMLTVGWQGHALGIPRKHRKAIAASRERNGTTSEVLS